MTSPVGTFAQPLQEWMEENLIGANETLIYKKAGIDQAVFFRDMIHPLLVRGVDPDARYRARRENPVRVVSTHRSKSVLLPVYQIRNDDVTLTARANFHDWKVSVETERPVPDLFHGLFVKDERVPAVYCEGFHPDWVYGSFNERDGSPSRFTVELGFQHPLWAFTYLLSVGLEIR